MAVDGVSYLENRVKFVKGILSGTPSTNEVLCGDGTEFPLQVTPAQLLEIFYRVKDSKVTGNIDLATGLPGFGVLQFAFTSASPNSTFYTYATTTIERAWADNSTPPPVNLTDEKQIWTADLALPSPAPLTVTGLTLAAYYDHQLTNGFSIFGQWDVSAYQPSPPTDYSPVGIAIPAGVPTDYHPAQFSLSFNGLVAVVDNAGNGNPFDPANELWVGMMMSGGADDGLFLYPNLFSTLSGDYLGNGDPGYQMANAFTLQLASSSVSCSIWGEWSFYTYSGGITVEATEWWPYKNKSGDPAWNSATGKPINGGPAA